MFRRRSRKRFRKVITTLNLLEHFFKKWILCGCEATDAGSQVIEEIVKMNVIEESDLPKNTKSSKKYKITIDESAEEVEKAKTTTSTTL